ncbi:MAG: RDD family protein [Bacteroidia bacterium]
MENDRLLDDVITTEGFQEMQTADLGVRFANLFIDGIIVRVLNTVLTLAIATIEPSIGYVVGFLTYFIYYIALEAATGQTLGKMITGTIVVDEHGQKIDGGKAAIRTICRIIPFEPLSFFGSKRRGWHDTISKTYVIKKPKY